MADETGTGKPVEEWIQHPVSDSADYLDRPAPIYGDSLSGEAKKEYDAAIAARTPAPKAPPKKRSGTRRRSKKR